MRQARRTGGGPGQRRGACVVGVPTRSKPGCVWAVQRASAAASRNPAVAASTAMRTGRTAASEAIGRGRRRGRSVRAFAPGTRSLSTAGPMWMRWPTCSSRGPARRSSSRKVPFWLPRSSRNSRSPRRVSRACRRLIDAWGSRRSQLLDRPRISAPSPTGSSCPVPVRARRRGRPPARLPPWRPSRPARSCPARRAACGLHAPDTSSPAAAPGHPRSAAWPRARRREAPRCPRCPSCHPREEVAVEVAWGWMAPCSFAGVPHPPPMQ